MALQGLLWYCHMVRDNNCVVRKLYEWCTRDIPPSPKSFPRVRHTDKSIFTCYGPSITYETNQKSVGRAGGLHPLIAYLHPFSDELNPATSLTFVDLLTLKKILVKPWKCTNSNQMTEWCNVVCSTPIPLPQPHLAKGGDLQGTQCCVLAYWCCKLLLMVPS